MWVDAAHSSLPLASQLSALAYPAVYVSAAVLTLPAIVSGSLRRSRSTASLLVLGGIVAQAIAFILWSHQLLRQSYSTGATVLDPLWVIGMLAIAAGGLLAARRPEADAIVPEPGRYGGVLPAVMFALLIAGLARAWILGSPVGAAVTLSAGLVLCG